MEEKVLFQAGDVTLEGLYHPEDETRVGVAAHPHPQYGGSMHNNVVKALTSAFNQAGWSSLRFNFRGVERSAGSYGQGLAERDDLAGALEFLRARGALKMVVAGYSFGAHVASFAWPKLRGPDVAPLILVAPPAAFMSFDDLPPDTRVGLMVCGERDDIAPPDLAADFGRRLDPPVQPVVVEGADHFFGGQENRLQSIVADYLAQY